jgi:uncharacterized protein (TIGR01777 family)
VRWDPAQGIIDADALGTVDAVIHLAGENLASGRWTVARKKRIRESRVAGTRLLSETLAALAQPPRVLLSASAVGYYGDRGSETLTESSAPGVGFLAEVCQAWEAATAPASSAGIRVAHLRFGIILSANGGALARMLPLFRAGLAGPLGPGSQYWSWISIDDAVAAIDYALQTDALCGPVNLVASQPVTNREFTRVLAAQLRRPAFFRAPAWALKLALGPMAEEALLASARAVPARLIESGFAFEGVDLTAVLQRVTG